MSATLELTGLEAADELPAVRGIQPSTYLEKKRLCVRAMGVLLGILLAPIILLLIGAVRLTSPGPGLYRQRRVGLNGREFTIYKLRSMRQDAEKLSGPVWAAKKDDRVTPLGHFLRWTHLDELPQIFNVIIGEMDFVGPRPERPEIVDELVQKLPDYTSRLAAMPGITGSAQVNLPPDQTVDCVRYKVAADRHYIENASLWLDLRLIAATLLRCLGVRYERGTRVLGVGLPVVIEQQLTVNASLPTARSVGVTKQDSAGCDETRVFAALTDTVADVSGDSADFEREMLASQARLPR